MNWSTQRLHAIQINSLQPGPVAKLPFPNIHGPYMIMHNAPQCFLKYTENHKLQHTHTHIYNLLNMGT